MNSVAASPMNPQTDIHSSRVLILDFGAQYTQLIARRVREHGVFCEILPWDVTNDDVRKWKPKGIILSGGPESVTDKEPPRAPQVVFELGVPVLGICYGMQTMAQQLGGRVRDSAITASSATPKSPSIAPNKLFDGLFDRQDADGRGVLDVWMSHGDKVETLPPGFTAVAQQRQRAARRHGRRIAALLRRAVPSRSHAHAAGQAAARALRARDLRLRAAVERRQHHRRRHRARARAGGQGQGAARPLGRRGFLGRRRAAAQGHRRPADLRVRRPRPHAPQRRRPGHEDLRRQPRRESHPRRCRSALPRRAARRNRSREEAQDHRRPVREGVRRGSARSSRTSTGSRRALSTRTSSSPRAARPARRTSSSRTTTWAACRRTCA